MALKCLLSLQYHFFHAVLELEVQACMVLFPISNTWCLLYFLSSTPPNVSSAKHLAGRDRVAKQATGLQNLHVLWKVITGTY